MHDRRDSQQRHWEQTYTEKPEMFGEEPSVAARAAAELFSHEGKTAILELGGGHGRDTLFFARRGFRVTVLDYSAPGMASITDKAKARGYVQTVTAMTHDVRQPLSLPNASVDGCYSHMLFCMAMTTQEIEALMREVWRVLRPGGLHVYTVRHTGDPHYGVGIHHSEDRYETGGFEVHFFNREMIDHLTQGFELLGVEEFEEGSLPRRLYLVTLRKPEQ
ncbi:MAG: methyltransferase domain-containing protein [Thermomicrobiales bacterium]